MFRSAIQVLKAITTDDDRNVIPGMVRVGWVAGLSVYLASGVAMISACVKITWSGTATDYQAFGIGMGAWAAGLSAYIVSGGGALWMQAKADALPAVVQTIETPNKTVTTETPVQK